jgi:hypothetical protein
MFATIVAILHGQKMFVLDLPHNLENVTINFHCTCYDFPSCFAQNI